MGQKRKAGWGRAVLARGLLAGMTFVSSLGLRAAEIEEFLPQGRVSGAEAVQLRFSSPAAAFGDPTAPVPVDLACEGPVPAGQGRWLDDRRWTYMFERTVPAGVRCVATPNPDFRTLDAKPLPPGSVYSFNTGAPAIVDSRPYEGWEIDEAQAFILRFDAPVDQQAVAGHSHCVIEGVGERIPVEAVEVADRKVLLRAAGMPEPEDPAMVALLQCARVLPADGKVRLAVGPGVRAVGQPESLPGSERPHVLEYKVRAPFLAKVSCTRERAGKPCLPVAPISVSFTSPVPRDALAEMTLRAGERQFEPRQDDDTSDVVSYVTYPGPFPAGASLVLSLPEGVSDETGRPLDNADRYPLTVPVAEYPPLVKFASGTFGVVERFAHAPPGRGAIEMPAVPVTVRQIEADPTVRAAGWSAGKVAQLSTVDDVDVLRWYARLQRLESGTWSEAQLEDIARGRAPRDDYGKKVRRRDVRSVSVLRSEASARRLSLPEPPAEGARPFEVMGIPLPAPGFHVLEIESPRLGASLLEHGGPMYVRSGVLLTNLSLHVKQGRDDLLVWVTALADGVSVAQAEVRVMDCNGKPLAGGQTDAQGLWHHRAPVAAPDYCRETGLQGLFVSARIAADHPQAYGAADYAFVLSSWDRGIEAWRFNVPTSSSAQPERLAHTVFDRSLFRAGETVSMKHFLREEARDGLRVPRDGRPDRLIIEHEGSSQQHELPVGWRDTPSGGLAALSEFVIPASAALGSYTVRLTDEAHAWYGSSRFRVEEFRLPILAGRLEIAGGSRADLLIAPKRMDVALQLAWLSGGPASGQQVTLSVMTENRLPRFDGYDDYSFVSPPGVSGGDADADAADTSAYREEEDDGQQRKLFVDGRAFVLDANGMARLPVDTLPDIERPQRFQLEASFAEPNGEVQTISRSVDVWPASIQAGVKVEGWVRSDRDIPVSLLALGPDAKPQAGVSMQLLAVERKIYTVRKRMVGGFYRYDSRTERKEIGTVCEGRTDAAGTLPCSVRFDRDGAFELVAIAQDANGRSSRAYTSLWVSGTEELWFGGQDDDRIDLIPAKREWAAGDVAQFQVRMPFREAVALVTVEREGVLWKELVALKGSHPVVTIPVSGDWGPNAYVSVLVLRGRLYELPWQSFLQWGWRRPADWLAAFRENPDDTLVTNRIDLAKPAFRLGVSEIRIADQTDRLDVALTPSRTVASVRDDVSVRLQVRLPDGSPAAHATAAFAVVDEALLELAPNESWLIYEAMHPRRSLSVRTATTQLEVVGRRHYGRKAVAAGGGGGSVPTRQLFDTLLSWQPMVRLDANGEADVRFRLNDALSRFRLVAIADHGSGYFGTASTTIVTRQDLQVVSGLPPLVREGDQYRAQVTVRNATPEERQVEVRAVVSQRGEEVALPARTLRLSAGGAAVASWQVSVPDIPWPDGHGEIGWRFEANDEAVADRVVVSQRVEPRQPAITVQAALRSVPAGNTVTIPLAAPDDALRAAPGQVYGGISLDVSTSLAGSLRGVTEWWQDYPYTCLEQSASQALALGDMERWSAVVGSLASHMDDDGLLRYFPGTGPGSDVLTAYLVSAHDEARRLGSPFTLPDEGLQRMLAGLQAFVEGRLKRDMPLWGTSMDSRRIMALEALARHGRATPAMLSSVQQSTDDWPTPTVVDWMSILLRMPDASHRAKQVGHARSVLISRMSVSGGAMAFSDAPLHAAPALMATRVTSLSRLMQAVMERPEWQDDLPRMARGLVQERSRGAWAITTENLQASFALQRFGRHFEPVTATGIVRASIGEAAVRELALAPGGESPALQLSWPGQSDVLKLNHEGEGVAWVDVRAQARVPTNALSDAGYRIERRIVPVTQAVAGAGWSRGDVYRVELEIQARDSATWAVLTDPVPAGATILGSGLGRDARLQLRGPGDDAYPPAYEERTAGAYRAYFDYLPAGRVRLSYTVRLNTVGSFLLPATRIEALYRPDLHGSHPNDEPVNVKPGPYDAAAH